MLIHYCMLLLLRLISATECWTDWIHGYAHNYSSGGVPFENAGTRLTANSPEECQRKCQQDDDCVYWNLGDGVCLLKSQEIVDGAYNTVTADLWDIDRIDEEWCPQLRFGLTYDTMKDQFKVCNGNTVCVYHSHFGHVCGPKYCDDPVLNPCDIVTTTTTTTTSTTTTTTTTTTTPPIPYHIWIADISEPVSDVGRDALEVILKLMSDEMTNVALVTHSDKPVCGFGHDISRDHCYWLETDGYITNPDDMTGAWKNVVFHSGSDEEESQMDALYRALVDPRLQSDHPKTVHMMTDAEFHMAGDGASCGLTARPKFDMDVNDCISHDYPGAKDIADAIKHSNTQQIDVILAHADLV
eukprot:GHVO01013130.1.p1 GENE.GHVO01013130.1~~GHVO01013130.1.p1  ORF type:complete len:355 (+),score=41.95 GHVO01013130.1:457-1521(+)